MRSPGGRPPAGCRARSDGAGHFQVVVASCGQTLQGGGDGRVMVVEHLPLAWLDGPLVTQPDQMHHHALRRAHRGQPETGRPVDRVRDGVPGGRGHRLVPEYFAGGLVLPRLSGRDRHGAGGQRRWIPPGAQQRRHRRGQPFLVRTGRRQAGGLESRVPALGQAVQGRDRAHDAGEQRAGQAPALLHLVVNQQGRGDQAVRLQAGPHSREGAAQVARGGELVVMVPDQLQLTGDRLAQLGVQVQLEGLHQGRRFRPLVRGRRLAGVARHSAVGNHERQDAADLPGGTAAEHGGQQRGDWPVREQAAVRGPVTAGHVGEIGHVGPGRDPCHPGDLLVDRDKRGLERPRERGTTARGQGQGVQGRPVRGVRRQILLVEREQAVVVHVGHHGPVIVGELARLTGHHRRGDEHGGVGRGDGSERCPRSGAPFPEALDPLGQLGEQHLVALHQRRGIALRRIAQQQVHRASLEPQVTQHGQVGPGRAGQPEECGVDPARARSCEHVHRDGDIEAVQQPPVQVTYLRIPARGRGWPAPGGRPCPVPGRASGRSGGGAVRPAGGGPGGLIRHRAGIALKRTARLLEQVDLPGHSAHPDRQAHPAGHGHGEPHVLGGPGVGGAWVRGAGSGLPGAGSWRWDTAGPAGRGPLGSSGMAGTTSPRWWRDIGPQWRASAAGPVRSGDLPESGHGHVRLAQSPRQQVRL